MITVEWKNHINLFNCEVNPLCCFLIPIKHSDYVRRFAFLRIDRK